MILLKFEKEIKGNSQREGYKDWIECATFGVTCNRHFFITNSERNPTPANISDIIISKGCDISSPYLFSKSLAGESLGKAEIHFIQEVGEKSTSQTYMKYICADAVISSYSTSASGGRPVETIQINFTKIDHHYVEFTGSEKKPEIHKGYDLLQRTVC